MKIVLFILIYVAFGIIAQRIFVRDFVEKFFVDDGKREEESDVAFRFENVEEGKMAVHDAIVRDFSKESKRMTILRTVVSLTFWPILVPLGMFLTHKVWTKEIVRKDMIDSFMK